MKLTVFAIAAASLVVLVLPGAGAASTQTCSLDSTFCVTADLTVTSDPAGLIAAAPASLDFSVANTSPSHTDQTYWLHSATLTLASNGIASPPTLTASDQLPSGLLLAGGGTCTSPDFTDCPGGHGTIVGLADISGSDFAASGTFGIAKIVNIDPAGMGDYGDYNVTLDTHLCPPSPYPCFDSSSVEEVTIPQPPAGVPATASFAIATEGSTPIPGGFGAVYYALDSFTFHVDGESSQLDSGPADQTYTILALPDDCGTATGSSDFASHSAQTVSVPESITIAGCPTAALAPFTVSGSTVHLDGSGSATTIDGRTIAQWHWTFGDGKTAVTTAATVGHAYKPGSTHTVKLYVEDSAGARSASVTEKVEVPACTVPKVKSMTLAAAKAKIKAAHCSVGTVKKAYSNTVATGTVISQRPPSGAVEARGAAVSLVVSKGKKR